ncbi:MAG: molecular chaperone TorD family protein [Berryella intestinalis]|uniref:molecular chaperone TorD family protein n=1 Tax=Berryella intestinalis TaxID=1531429 RepID=UPI002A531496|nr:molecular chaperone TorD family protein [Berryella intestinalis]MDD7369585.1 molecular chaperone TorD family protein [Berryella intestinalis]MDY3129366.1 molecular chaperone TorD family protein [Berryella intestinalis]
MCERETSGYRAGFDEGALAGVSFVSDSLAPFFIFEPGSAEVGALFDAFAGLDADAAADEWPFVAREDALGALVAMREGAADRFGLCDEFARLFVGPQAKVAPQWGSVYTDRDGALFGRTTSELRAWLRERDAVVAIEPNMPEDHFGRMLAALSRLAADRPERLSEFMGQHLLPWSPRFLDRLEEGATSGFFKGLARITRLSLEGIGRELRIEARAVRTYR